MKKQTEKATFAMGCFWSPQKLFDDMEGVLSTRVGYTGGSVENPSYQEVCTGRTGHVEAIEIIFDPAKVSYLELLEIFWNNHNPTQGDRQGVDVGNQYRSAVFYHNSEQKKLAEKSKENKQKKLSKTITTTIEKAGKFYPAEDYHQKYLEKRGIESCHI